MSVRVSTTIPPVTNGRAPYRSDSFPASGARMMIRTVQGRNDAPASDRRVAEHVLDVQRDVEEHAEHREPDEEHHRVRPGEALVAEEAELEHRQPLVVLEEQERDERDDRDPEGDQDPRRRPAVGVRLDQAVGEREEADRRGDEPGEVGPLLVRGVARLVDQQVRRDDPEHADRDVDEEDPAPAEPLGDDSADERADREREGRDAGPDADRGAALPRAGTSRR